MRNKKKEVVSLLTIVVMCAGLLAFVGISLNWNLFYVYGGCVIILSVGLCIIFLPDIIKHIYTIIYNKIEKKADETIKEVKKL